MTASDTRRHVLLELFREALTAVDGRACTRRALATCESERAVWVAAVGKAACSMALGAHDALGAALQSTLLITKDGHVAPEAHKLPGAEVIESSHPVPDSRSLRAGERLLQWVDELPAAVKPVFLVSGGASSLVEALAPGVTLDDLQRLNTEGLASATSIEALNERRKQISRLKGGRLASKLRGRSAQALFISDVPGDHPAVIGSGLLGPSPDGADDVTRTVIASIDHAMQAARERAIELGLQVKVEPTRFSQEAERLAVRFTHELNMDAVQVRVWGGESVMQLPPHPGRGGRNQHLALAAARLIAGYEELALLAAGTDGTDGPTADAGAVVDSNTCARLALADLDVDDCLWRADSGSALEASGDLIHTGPTGTNVGDIVIGLKLSETDARALQHRTRLRHSSQKSPVL